ncbi:MAG: TIGR01244 family sulfur transferase [Hyphomicrobiaceae bacterium]
MDKIIHITPMFAVTAALAPQDFATVAVMGFKSIISNRPDGEEPEQMPGRIEAAHAWRHGLRFAHVPAAKLDLFTDPVVEGMADAIRALDGPMLAHCKSGVRSAIVWAAASARSQSVDCVIAALESAGFELDFLRDDLDRQADRRRWLGDVSPALDCGCAGQSASLPGITAKAA